MTAVGTSHFHTTIKVSSDVRDRLKALADSDGRTLGAEIDHLVSLAERKARMEAFAADIAALSPEEMASYQREIDFWDAVSG